jgi:hypothetical protein
MSSADRRSVVRWTARAVYAVLGVMCLWLWLNFGLIWGQDGMQWMRFAEATRLNNLFFHLFYAKANAGWVLGIHAVSLVLAAIGWLGFIPRLLVFVTAGMIYFSAFSLLTGGYALLWQMSFFLIFFNVGSRSPRFGDWSAPVLWALRMQVVMMYAFSSINKWIGTTWVEGSSLYYVLRNEAFASDDLASFAIAFPFLTVALTWAALAYQTVFPIAVWFRPLRPGILWVGVAFHLFIGLFLGLPDFALAVFASYLCFLPVKKD